MAKKKKRKGSYSSVHQKLARVASGNTLRALKFVRSLDAKHDNSHTIQQDTEK